MKLNRRMLAHLLDLRSRNVAAEPQPLFAGRADPEILEAGGCVLLRQFLSRARGTLANHADPTALECCANKLSMGDLLDPRLVSHCPLLMLLAGLAMAERLSRRLTAYQGIFNVIVSYDGDCCAVRFHRLRKGERWLLPDLEDYSEEGVLVFEAGEAMPEPRLLSA